MSHIWVAVRQRDGQYAVRTKHGARWYTVAEVFAVPEQGDALEIANQIVRQHEAQDERNVSRSQ